MELHAFRELEAENRLDFDIYTHIVSAPGSAVGESEDSLAPQISIAEGFRTKHIHPHFVKFILDGVPMAPNFTHAQLDAEGKVDPNFLLVKQNTLLERIKLYDAKGYTCKVHAAGEGSARLALDILEQVRALNPNGPRHEVAHCNSVHAGEEFLEHNCTLWILKADCPVSRRCEAICAIEGDRRDVSSNFP